MSTAMELTEVEKAALRQLLHGEHPCAIALRRQIANATVRSRDWTGVGFFAYFTDLDERYRLAGPDRASLTGAFGTLPDIDGVVQFVLFIDNGLAQFLEGHLSRFDWQTADDPTWPESLRDAVTQADQTADELRRAERLREETLALFTCSAAVP